MRPKSGVRCPLLPSSLVTKPRQWRMALSLLVPPGRDGALVHPSNQVPRRCCCAPPLTSLVSARHCAAPLAGADVARSVPPAPTTSSYRAGWRQSGCGCLTIRSTPQVGSHRNRRYSGQRRDRARVRPRHLPWSVRRRASAMVFARLRLREDRRPRCALAAPTHRRRSVALQWYCPSVRSRLARLHGGRQGARSLAPAPDGGARWRGRRSDKFVGRLRDAWLFLWIQRATPDLF